MSEAEIKMWAGLLSPDSPLGLQMAALRLSSRGHPSVCVDCVLLSSYKDICHTGSGPTLMTTFLTSVTSLKALSSDTAMC